MAGRDSYDDAALREECEALRAEVARARRLGVLQGVVLAFVVFASAQVIGRLIAHIEHRLGWLT